RLLLAPPLLLTVTARPQSEQPEPRYSRYSSRNPGHCRIMPVSPVRFRRSCGAGPSMQRRLDMLPHDCLDELRSAWLPNITDTGLNRLMELLEQGSPLLISGCFTRAIPMGCLASHAAWHHPITEHLCIDAGITWLHGVAGLNPATSRVLREWDL